MDGSYVLTSETTKKTDLCIFCQKVKKGENFSSTSTRRKELIDLSNKLKDELLKGITDLSVIQYHSNGCYKPYTLQAQRELKNRKRKGHRTENKNKIDAQNHKNQMTIEVKNALYAETKLLQKTVNFTDYVKLKKLFLRATKFNMAAVFTKVSIFDKPDDLFAADIIESQAVHE